MKILALIPARGGSKRLPGKNIRLLGGKPLVVWSIDAAKNISEVCDILVSTDDPDIGATCARAGALVPWLRPAPLSTDGASSVDVALHALDWYEAEKGAVDGILLLQPTSPFRTTETIRNGIALFRYSDRNAVLGVSSLPIHPLLALKIEDGHLVPLMNEHALETRSQDLPAAYAVNGSLYLITPDELRVRRSFLGANTIPLLVKAQQEALDIDTPLDFKMAESIAADM